MAGTKVPVEGEMCLFFRFLVAISTVRDVVSYNATTHDAIGVPC